MQTQKLQKVLADLGYGSRRELEGWITAGRVSVNGETAHLGQRVGTSDVIHVDDRRAKSKQSDHARVLVLNKSAGVVCSRRDPEGRRTIFDALPRLKGGRWISVGRLDIQTTGLLLLTNDGALAHRLMHPSTGLDREYAVRVDGRLDEEVLAALKTGVVIDGETHQFSDVQYYNGSGRNHWYHVVLLEGKNREVRKLFEHVGFTVSRLKRVRYGPVILPSTLLRGKLTELSRDDLKALYRLLKLPLKAKPNPQRRDRKRPSLLLPYPELELLGKLR
ncbi:MAG: pseudouridine synthase [Gammaproteobacteria bacterium]|nr:pseudouridine synthase [Gammaproteobacteria bacterium]